MGTAREESAAELSPDASRDIMRSKTLPQEKCVFRKRKMQNIYSRTHARTKILRARPRSYSRIHKASFETFSVLCLLPVPQSLLATHFTFELAFSRRVYVT